MRLLALLALLAAGLLAGAVVADDKKDDKKAEKIDPAKLVGEWKGKRPAIGLPINVVDVWEFTKGGELTVKVAQPDDVANGMRQAVGTYKVNGATVEATVKTIDLTTTKPGEKPATEPKPDAKAEAMTMEVVKLTETELHLKVDKHVNELVRVTAEDKDTTVDTAKLPGRWRTKRTMTDGKDQVVGIAEFTKDGKAINSTAPPGDVTKVKKEAEGTYTLTEKKLTVTYKEDGEKKAATRAFEIVKLTDTGLTLRIADEKSDEKGVVIGFERVKEEKKEK